MEQFGILEKKLSLLIESKRSDMLRIAELDQELVLVKEECFKMQEQLEHAGDDLRGEVGLLKEENQQLRLQAEKLEEALLARHQSLEGLSQERELTKMAVDDLIKSIDVLIEPER